MSMRKFSTYSLWCFAFFLSCTLSTYANIGGITGRSLLGCGDCHGGAQSAATAVNLLPIGTTTVAMTPGETRTFQIAVAHASAPSAGINISIKNSGGSNAGTFTAGSGLRLVSGELTHSSPQLLSGNPRQVVFSFSWTAPTAPGAYTLRAAGNAVNGNGSDDNGDNWKLMSSVTINVAGLTLTAPNGGEVWCRGGDPNIIRWSSSGITQVTLDYTSGDGSWLPIAIVNATPSQYSWTIPGTAQPGANYLVRIRETGGSAQDISNATFSVGAAPTIVTNLKVRDSACLGAEKTFSVVTDNNMLYSFQWQKDGSDIQGATSASYGIQNVNPSHNGNYKVRVIGCGQTITSQEMYFYGLEAAQITSQPSNVSVCEGKTATLSVGASGWQLSYRWKRNGKDVSGGNKANLVIGNVNSTNVGEYECEVKGGCGTKVLTDKVTLSAKGAPKVNSSPKDTTLCIGPPGNIGVDVNDDTDLTFQWKLNGKSLPSATTKILSIPNFSVADTGNYEITITNACSLKTTVAMRVSARPPVTIAEHPTSITVTSGGKLVLRVKAVGKNLNYQWYKNNAVIPDATKDSLVVNKVSSKNAGEYTCRVNDNCSNVESNKAIVNVEIGAGPLLQFTQEEIIFNCTSVGRTRTFAFPNFLKNSGTTELAITGVKFVGKNADEFSVIEPTTPKSILKDQEQNLIFRFSPKSAGLKEAQILFTCNTVGEDTLIRVSMLACESQIEPWQTIILKPIPVSQVSDSVVSICNSGSKTFQLINTELQGPGSDISLTAQDNTPKQMKSGDCHKITLNYAPKSDGPRTALLNFIAENQEIHPIIVQASTPVTGVEEEILNQSYVTAYPNPVNDRVVVEINNFTEQSMITIRDNIGNTVFVSDLVGKSFEWDTKEVSSGVYNITITNRNKTITIPIIVSK